MANKHADSPHLLPSIRSRLLQILLIWSTLLTIAVSLAVWFSVKYEVNGLLDDTLQTSAQAMAAVMQQMQAPEPQNAFIAARRPQPSDITEAAFAWQLIRYSAKDGASLEQASDLFAATAPIYATPTLGFSNLPDWRVFGQIVTVVNAGDNMRILYVAQSSVERDEELIEVTLSASLACIIMAMIAYVWLRLTVARELKPLQSLAYRLTMQDALIGGASVGAAERQELQVVHTALDTLSVQLAKRIANEHAFSAHAAHALRTPLAGMDAQLAVALRESPPHLQARLQTIRFASRRLQRVVAALLAMFRSGAHVQLQSLNLKSWIEQLPLEGLEDLAIHLELDTQQTLHADSDLLAAALLNLLDNALRHGAHQVTFSCPMPGCLRLHDDGPGLSPEKREEILRSLGQDQSPGTKQLSANQYEARPVGLGLVLADLIARAHGGMLVIPQVTRGFAVELDLQPGRRIVGALR